MLTHITLRLYAYFELLYAIYFEKVVWVLPN